MSVSHLLNRTLEVWRPTETLDGMGGVTVTLVQQDDVKAMVSQPSATEQQVAAQWESTHSHNVYTAPSADVSRGDELRGDGQAFRVLSTVQASRPVYLKALAELTQHEGG